MIRNAHSFTRGLVAAGLLVSALAVTATTASAASDEFVSATWMAASESTPVISTNWGRLMLRDGVLSFRSNTTEWQLATTEIKRASISRESDNVMLLETVSGQTYYVTIYGAQLTVASPHKALEVIQKASRTTAARR